MFKNVVVLVGCLAACGGPANIKEGRKLSAKELIEQYKPAIVRIEGDAGVGTGFVVAEDGRIATNLHVILGSRELKVTFADGRTLPVREIASYRREHDLAIVRVDAAQKLPSVRLGNSDIVAAGDPVIAIGNPLGVLDYTVSDGLISSVREYEGMRLLQTTAPISVGSSGGPIFNSYGEVIGIATFFAEGGQNLNFAQPSNYLSAMLGESQPVSLAEFFDVTSEMSAPRRTHAKHPQIERNVPDHPVSMLDKCSRKDMEEAAYKMQGAIQMGAPIYNRGEYEACYVVYRNTAKTLEREKDMCRGIRDALGQGLLRADGEDDPAAQAWALRDAFDGLLLVMQKKLRSEEIQTSSP